MRKKEKKKERKKQEALEKTKEILFLYKGRRLKFIHRKEKKKENSAPSMQVQKTNEAKHFRS